MGKTLWVASVDISNAFPLVDRSTLWQKLRDLGAAGRLLDWMRMIYELMRYRVRHEGEFSEDDITSGIGILTGDTMSSEFWIIFFGDLHIPVTDDDIMLAGIAISHLEQAGDLLLLALSPEGLQCKMNLFYTYCGNNFLLINAIKSAIGYHGPAPPVPRLMPIFYFNGEQVKIVDKCIRKIPPLLKES
jgi:hypothetical protein